MPEALADPHAVARGMVQEYDYPGAGRVKALGNPVKLSRSPAAASAAPRLGEDTDAVLAGLGHAPPRSPPFAPEARVSRPWRRALRRGRARRSDDPRVPGRTPRIHAGAYVDLAAQVIGDVTIEEGASVWPFSILRGDQDNYVRLGRNSNVQDNSVLHVTPEFPCIVGAGVTIGHRCVVHACTIMDNVRIGIGAVVLTGAVVEEKAPGRRGRAGAAGQGGAGGLAGHGRARQARAQDERGRARGHPEERRRLRRPLAARLPGQPGRLGIEATRR